MKYLGSYTDKDKWLILGLNMPLIACKWPLRLCNCNFSTLLMLFNVKQAATLKLWMNPRYMQKQLRMNSWGVWWKGDITLLMSLSLPRFRLRTGTQITSVTAWTNLLGNQIIFFSLLYCGRVFWCNLKPLSQCCFNFSLIMWVNFSFLLWVFLLQSFSYWQGRQPYPRWNMDTTSTFKLIFFWNVDGNEVWKMVFLFLGKQILKIKVKAVLKCKN
jgi:hypothetical protein